MRIGTRTTRTGLSTAVAATAADVRVTKGFTVTAIGATNEPHRA